MNKRDHEQGNVSRKGDSRSAGRQAKHTGRNAATGSVVSPFMYDDYLRRVAERFDNRFRDIGAEYNFELGVEFEITLCRVLRQVLPQRFGICRGFVVTRDGTKAGDDIIIYDRDTFPTLRIVDQDGFERKEAIPVEAVYAYIEAKHTLCIEGDGDQSLVKAYKQVRAVKSLPRDPVPWISQDPYVSFADATLVPPTYWPESRNQLYVGIVARYVRGKPRGRRLNGPEGITEALETADLGSQPEPDLIIAGPDVVCLPCIDYGFHSPFLIPEKSHLTSHRVPGLAFGIGICSMLFAVDMMRLGAMPWPLMIAESLGLPTLSDADRGDVERSFSFPVFIISDDKAGGAQTVKDEGTSYLALFRSNDNAMAYVREASLNNSSVTAIENYAKLHSLMGDCIKQGVHQVMLDPASGAEGNLTIQAAFLLEHLDQWVTQRRSEE